MGQARYDREFKELVVRRILNGETTTAKMSRELELHKTRLGTGSASIKEMARVHSLEVATLNLRRRNQKDLQGIN